LLSYDITPKCIWISQSETREVSCAIDERLFGDTLIQAEYVNGTYILRHLFMLNSCRVPSGSTSIKDLMPFFFSVPHLEPILYQTGSCIVRSDLPDVYFVEGSYLQVPDIQTSEYLRSLGDSFILEIEERDGLWFIKNPCLK